MDFSRQTQKKKNIFVQYWKKDFAQAGFLNKVNLNFDF